MTTNHPAPLKHETNQAPVLPEDDLSFSDTAHVFFQDLDRLRSEHNVIKSY